MRDEPSKILLIVAPTNAAARIWAQDAGLMPAMALGHLRVVTRPAGLRGWRSSTLFVATGWSGNENNFGEMNAVLSALMGSGSLRAAMAKDLETFGREVMA